MFSPIKSQISLPFDDGIVPRKERILESDIFVDRGSKYGYGFTQVQGKEDIKTFLKYIRSTKSFDTADHCSYAFRILSSEGILVEGKGDDGETGAGQCILRELKRRNIEQVILVVSRHFGGVYLQTDRYKNVVNVAKMGIERIINK
ncbi:MAG: YigZ family protein [Candidatus Gracilibacteria bacterium]|nr:YigZ family protein [Candidatus Gracilibacteria bacterium]